MIKAVYNGFEDNTLTILHTSDNLQEGTEYHLELAKETRSIQQNKYIHKVFNLISDKTGYTPFEVKTIILFELGHTQIVTSKKTGKEYEALKPTSDLNKKEFSELTEQIIQWCNEKGFEILTPEEYFITNFK